MTSPQQSDHIRVQLKTILRLSSFFTMTRVAPNRQSKENLLLSKLYRYVIVSTYPMVRWQNRIADCQNVLIASSIAVETRPRSRSRSKLSTSGMMERRQLTDSDEGDVFYFYGDRARHAPHRLAARFGER